MARVGIYARISRDEEGDGLGVTRQVEDCTRLISQRNWEVAATYIDNDVSAYQRSVRRPEFERMLSDLIAGTTEGIVVYDLDRLARQPRDVERVVDAYDEPGRVFATVQADLNLASSDGRTMARVMVAFANKSSADTARRTARKHRELREAGKPVGGVRPFGWQEDKVTLHPTEAPRLRQAVDDVLSGKSLHSIAMGLNRDGVTTTANGPWTHTTLRRLLRNGRLAGWRTHKYAIALTDAGAPISGTWQPLIDQDTYEALLAALGERGARQPKQARPGARRYLASGLLRCGECNAKLTGQPYRNERHNYSCPCGKVALHGPKTDDLLTQLVLALLAEESAGAEVKPWSGEGRIEGLETQRAELMAAYSDGRLPSDVVFPEVSRISAEREVLLVERAEYLRAHHLPAVGRRTIVEAWEAWDIEQRRARIEALVDHVVVTRSSRRGAPWDPTRLHPVRRG